MKTLARILALVAALCAIPAAAQTQFPTTLPANTVWGRTGIGPGPGQAIPFGVLFGNLFGGAAPVAHGVLIGEGTAALNSATCAASLPLVGNGVSVDPSCQLLTAAGIASATILNANLANMAAGTVKGSVAGGTPADLTQAQLTSLCNLATASLSGCVPAWPNNTTTFFRGDGTFATPPTVTSGAAGYAPAFPNNTTTFFRGDGTYAALPSHRQIIALNSSSATLAQNTTGFMLNFISTTEVNVESLCPIGGTFKNLFVLSTAPAGGQTLTATWRVNGGDTALTCTVTGTGTTCNDTTHTATCTAGQSYDLKVVTSATTGTMNFIAGGIEFDNP